MLSDELFISYFFPPSSNISGIVQAKRIIVNNKRVDVLTTHQDKVLSDFINDFIDNRIIVEVLKPADSPEGIREFVSNSLKVLGNHYKRIYSRSWLMSNHFLALMYKLENPDVHWTAEFSDPLLHDIKNTVNLKEKHKIDDDEFFNYINGFIKDYPKLKNNSSTFFTVEYLTFLFADEIIFTNANQREVMINQFPVDLDDLIMDKSVISPHPTLSKKYYHLIQSRFKLNHDYINIAYFGGFYYPERNFDYLFRAFDELGFDKIRLYIFINNRKMVESSNPNIYIKKPLDYLEFLNSCNDFDVLLVNDVSTRKYWSVNPYLPSKLSDYLGSTSDIWAIVEKNSSLDNVSVKYKSYIDDYDSILNVLKKIIRNHNSLCEKLFSKVRR